MARTFGCVFLLLGSVVIANAQTAFEVASLKPNNSGEGGYRLTLYPGGRLQGRNLSLQYMIQVAWDLKEKDQVTGTLSWLDADRYDLDANAGKVVGEPEARVMMQTLLLERFKLKIHRDTKDAPVYFLVQAKKGASVAPGLHAAPSGDCGAMATPATVPPPGGTNASASPCSGIAANVDTGKLTGHRADMPELAIHLSMVMRRPVFDRTEIKGSYDFTLTWTPDQSVVDAPGPSIYTALQEQLGVKLEAGKSPVEIIVVDSAEKASGN
jgi:uncharacterized protein (TIGR03435 family)